MQPFTCPNCHAPVPYGPSCVNCGVPFPPMPQPRSASRFAGNFILGCLAVGVFLVIGFFLVFALIYRHAQTVEIAHPTPSPTDITKVIPGPKTTAWKWIEESGKSAMSDAPSETLAVEADNQISGWLQTFKPVLFVRCREGKVDVYIQTGMSSNPEYGLYNEYTVRIRLDDDYPIKQRWSGATSNDALFAPNGLALAKKIAGARRMLFEFTPYNASSATASFDVEGLNALLPKVEQACKR